MLQILFRSDDRENDPGRSCKITHFYWFNKLLLKKMTKKLLSVNKNVLKTILQINKLYTIYVVQKNSY